MADDYVDADGRIRWVDQDATDDGPGAPSTAPALGTRGTTSPVAPRPVFVTAPGGGEAGEGLTWEA